MATLGEDGGRGGAKAPEAPMVRRPWTGAASSQQVVVAVVGVGVVVVVVVVIIAVVEAIVVIVVVAIIVVAVLITIETVLAAIVVPSSSGSSSSSSSSTFPLLTICLPPGSGRGLRGLRSNEICLKSSFGTPAHQSNPGGYYELSTYPPQGIPPLSPPCFCPARAWRPGSSAHFPTLPLVSFHFIDLISSRRNTHKETDNRHQKINVEDNKDTEAT